MTIEDIRAAGTGGGVEPSTGVVDCCARETQIGEYQCEPGRGAGQD